MTDIADKAAPDVARQGQSHGISFSEAVRVWARIAALSFGARPDRSR